MVGEIGKCIEELVKFSNTKKIGECLWFSKVNSL